MANIPHLISVIPPLNKYTDVIKTLANSNKLQEPFHMRSRRRSFAQDTSGPSEPVLQRKPMVV